MNDLQNSKALILRFYDELDKATGDEINDVLRRYTANEYHWRGMHPFYEQYSAEAVANVFWKPFRSAFNSVQRRPDIFMAGKNDVDGFQTEWVCSMGHLLGLFDRDWLGIPSTGKMGFLRYVEFNRISDGKISETALFVDIISIMLQAGQNPLPVSTGTVFLTPGPRTHDGLLYDAQDPAEGDKTLKLMNRMASELTSSDLHSSQDELASTWHDDMLWFGPAGIGSAFTLERYEAHHQGPFSDGLTDFTGIGHVARIAEGNFGCWFGWANMTMRPRGGFLGMPASDRIAEMRVVDLYRREGDKLAENWVFIDLLHFLSMQGLNVLERMKRINRR